MLLFCSKVVACHLSPFNFPFPLSNSFRSPIYLYCLLVSTPPTHDRDSTSPSLSTTSHFVVQYLIKSCGLPSDQTAKASRYMPHLKTPEKHDAMLRFQRQVGVSETHINVVVLRDPRFLYRNVEKCLHPKMVVLQEIGFSSSDISLLFSIFPIVFSLRELKQKVLFWLGIFNSMDELLDALKNDFSLLTTSLKTISANISFLKELCGLSACQIVRLIKFPRLIASVPQALENKAKRDEELGVRCSSAMYLHALKFVSSLNQRIIDARINKLTSLGFSHEEVTILVSKLPYVLTKSEDIMSYKMEFLTKEVGCDMLYLVANPALLMYILEKRLIPRVLVRNVLKLKGFPVADQKVYSFMKKTEKQFVEKFVLPFEPDILGFL